MNSSHKSMPLPMSLVTYYPSFSQIPRLKSCCFPHQSLIIFSAELGTTTETDIFRKDKQRSLTPHYIQCTYTPAITVSFLSLGDCKRYQNYTALPQHPKQAITLYYPALSKKRAWSQANLANIKVTSLFLVCLSTQLICNNTPLLISRFICTETTLKAKQYLPVNTPSNSSLPSCFYKVSGYCQGHPTNAPLSSSPASTYYNRNQTTRRLTRAQHFRRRAAMTSKSPASRV